MRAYRRQRRLARRPARRERPGARADSAQQSRLAADRARRAVSARVAACSLFPAPLSGSELVTQRAGRAQCNSPTSAARLPASCAHRRMCGAPQVQPVGAARAPSECEQVARGGAANEFYCVGLRALVGPRRHCGSCGARATRPRLRTRSPVVAGATGLDYVAATPRAHGLTSLAAATGHWLRLGGELINSISARHSDERLARTPELRIEADWCGAESSLFAATGAEPATPNSGETHPRNGRAQLMACEVRSRRRRLARPPQPRRSVLPRNELGGRAVNLVTFAQAA